MDKELEITVKVNCSYEELNNELLEKGFEIKEIYELNDDYMIDSSININSIKKLEVLQKCILIRNIVGIKKMLLYKYKKYANNGDILVQGKVECPVEDIQKAKNFMEAINYKLLFNIYDKCIVYTNDQTELIVQLVNDKYIFIEMESKGEYINHEFDNIGEMIKHLDKYNLPYSKDSYFIKKAELILDEIKKNNIL